MGMGLREQALGEGHLGIFPWNIPALNRTPAPAYVGPTWPIKPDVVLGPAQLGVRPSFVTFLPLQEGTSSAPRQVAQVGCPERSKQVMELLS
jgi:hypothetical protein